MAEWTLAGLTAVLVGVTLWYAWQTRQMVQEAKDLRAAQIRPLVVVDFDIFRIPTIIHLVVRNVGVTAAHAIKFNFTPPLASALTAGDGANVADITLWRDGLAFLAPGTELPTLFDSTLQRNGKNLPERYEVNVRYKGPDGEDYDETHTLDIGVYWGVQYTTRKDMDDLVKAVETIRDVVKRWDKSGSLGVIGHEELAAQNDEEYARFRRLLALRQREQRMGNMPDGPPSRIIAYRDKPRGEPSTNG